MTINVIISLSLIIFYLISYLSNTMQLVQVTPLRHCLGYSTLHNPNTLLAIMKVMQAVKFCCN